MPDAVAVEVPRVTRAQLRRRTGQAPTVRLHNQGVAASMQGATFVTAASPVVDTVTLTTVAAEAQHPLPAPPDGVPLTRRQARDLAKSGTAVSAESPTAEPVVAESAESHTVEPLVADVLREPSVSGTADATATVPPQAAEASLDDFERAARLFFFTGETPVHAAGEARFEVPVAEPVAHVTDGRKPRRRLQASGAWFKRMAAASFSVGAMAIAGLLTVGMTTPAEAVAAADAVLTAAPAGDVNDPDSDEIQAFVAPAEVQNLDLGRTETYSAGTMVDLAGTVGISNYSSAFFTNDPNCSIQWPFAVGVTLTWGFGMRSGSMHEGIDFTPGEGAHIQAIADGVVRTSTDSGGAFGATVVIDHIVDGQLVSSRYAHLQYGSRQVEVGDTVSVGQFIGQTGNTGRSFGAHTHMELLQNGTTAIDPLPWLRSHATC